jgi:hypothetical protein
MSRPSITASGGGGASIEAPECGKFDSSDFRRGLPRFTPEALNANQALIQLLASIGERKKATYEREKFSARSQT